MKRAVIALLVVSAMALAGPAGASSKAKHNLPSPHIGQVAKDGNFAFVVKQIQCGVTSLGTGYLTTSAPSGSQFCLVTMSVKNDKTTARSFYASNQHAIDKHGNTLNADGGDVLYVPNDSAAEYSTLNPGVAITAVVPFQLATGDKIKSLQLHDSAFSGGVTVYNVG